jgi:hypothetical protein
VYSGFIAQEVESAAISLGYDFSGVDSPETPNGFYGLRYAEFTVPLVKAVQELSAQNAAMQNENDQLKAEVDRLKGLESRIIALEALLGTQETSKSDSQR